MGQRYRSTIHMEEDFESVVDVLAGAYRGVEGVVLVCVTDRHVDALHIGT